jgi:hypothetical protein
MILTSETEQLADILLDRLDRYRKAEASRLAATDGDTDTAAKGYKETG